MTTLIEDNELDTELQELHLVSKQWISDIDFIHDDIQFLKTLFRRSFSPLIKRDDFEAITDVLIKAVRIENALGVLKSGIHDHLHDIEHHVVDKDLSLGLPLLEIHNLLQLQHDGIFIDYQAIRKLIFELTKIGLKDNNPELIRGFFHPGK